MKKLLNKKGESLVESLSAILIFTLSSIMLYTMLTTAVDLNRTAKEADEAHAQQMIYAEQAESLLPGMPAGINGEGNVIFTMTDQNNNTIALFDFDVDIYRQDVDFLYAYVKKPEGVGP